MSLGYSFLTYKGTGREKKTNHTKYQQRAFFRPRQMNQMSSNWRGFHQSLANFTAYIMSGSDITLITFKFVLTTIDLETTLIQTWKIRHVSTHETKCKHITKLHMYKYSRNMNFCMKCVFPSKHLIFRRILGHSMRFWNTEMSLESDYKPRNSIYIKSACKCYCQTCFNIRLGNGDK